MIREYFWTHERLIRDKFWLRAQRDRARRDSEAWLYKWGELQLANIELRKQLEQTCQVPKMVIEIDGTQLAQVLSILEGTDADK